MPFIHVIYLSLVLGSFITSLVAGKYIPAMRLLPWLLGVTVLIELVSGILHYGFMINPYPVYHAGIPFLFFLQGYFFLLAIDRPFIKKALLWILIGNVLVDISLSLFVYEFTEFPGLAINVHAVIMIGCSIYILFTLDAIQKIPIHKNPLAWISVGTIIFYSSIFLLNGVYNYLVESKSQLRTLIHGILNNGSNCVLYSCIIVGLILSDRLKKQAARLNR